MLRAWQQQQVGNDVTYCLSLLDKPLTRRAAAAVAAEATTITAAREAAAAGPSRRLYQLQLQQQQEGLPLQSLSSSLPSDGGSAACQAALS